jgi:hypothetical protein
MCNQLVGIKHKPIGCYLSLYLLQAGQQRNYGSIAARAMKCFLLHTAQTLSRTHPAIYSVTTGGTSIRLIGTEREPKHSSPTSAEVKSESSHTFTPPYALMVSRGNLYFLINV